MPSRKIRVRANKSSSKAASTKTLKLNGVDLLNPNQPTETNAPANPETMLATPEQIAATAVTYNSSAPVGTFANPHGTPPAGAVDTADDTKADLSERAVARAAAAAAVAAFYNGLSLPFKAAVDLRYKSAINFNLGKNQSARSAALIAAIITYCDIQPDGTFIRGSGRVPGKLLGYTGKQATQTFAAGPESGGLSNLMPDRITYISGEISGRGCENAVFKLNFEHARNNMLAFNNTRDTGGKIFSAPLRLLRVIEARETKANNNPFPENIPLVNNPPASVNPNPDPNDPSVSDLPSV